MTGLQCRLDLRQDATYDLIINKDRNLNQIFEATFISGDTEYPFDFTPYSGATLQVRRRSGSSDVILEFNTLDGSIILAIGGKFSLIKTTEEMNKTIAGEWEYDMYLREDNTGEKRAFLSRRLKITSIISK